MTYFDVQKIVCFPIYVFVFKVILSTLASLLEAEMWGKKAVSVTGLLLFYGLLQDLSSC